MASKDEIKGDPSAAGCLPRALPGQCERLDSPVGGVNIYSHGAGPPLLLIHSVNAAASAAEVWPVYEHYGSRRRTFAMDLPGFGLSERSERPYTIRLMTDAIHATVSHIQEHCGTQLIDALALSLSCEFLARAAIEGGQFRTLAFVSPTGFSHDTKSVDSTLNQDSSFAYRLLTGPGWGRALFRLLTRPSVIRYFLRRTWGSAQIDECLWHYDILAAQQPGAEHAPLYFLAGLLFSRDILNIYQRLTQPVWMCHGIRGDFVNYRYAAFVRHRENWSHSVFSTGALPFFEQPAVFFRQYDGFLERGPPALRGPGVALE